MEIASGLLTVGNKKLGQSIHVWSLPALETCPGSTSFCRSACYANSGRYRFKSVRERLAWNLEQAQHQDFPWRMAKEIRRVGAIVVRVHVSGDFFDDEYAEKWLWIMRKSPRPRFYWYSRSWRCKAIRPILEKMAQLKCCKAWYSLDSEADQPDAVPPGIRLAYLQTQEAEEVKEVKADLVFRVRKLRSASRFGLPMVCPSEIVGSPDDTNCGNCQFCFGS